MSASSKFVPIAFKGLGLASLFLTLVLSSGDGRIGHSDHGANALQDDSIGEVETRSVASPAFIGPPVVEINQSVTRQALSFDGDRSLEVAIAVDEIRTTNAHYTIRLRLTSGSEQLIAVSAPTGGLQPEVRDMTGDNVRNDLVLAPKLFQWPLTILVNDGHDHFVLAVAPAPRGSLTSGEAESGRSEVRSTVALTSSGFRTSALSSNRRLFLPQPESATRYSTAQADAKLLSNPSSSGRAPPAFAAGNSQTT